MPGRHSCDPWRCRKTLAALSALLVVAAGCFPAVTPPGADVAYGQTEAVQIAPTPVPSAAPEPPYDCLATVSATRPLAPSGIGDDCRLTLADGGPAEITFYDDAQITFRTTWGGDDVFFFAARKGDRLIKVVGATIRPARYIALKFGGSIEKVKEAEIAYYSPGSTNGRPACLRDANNDYRPLNALCR